MISLSLPVFLNLYKGQVNFWITICVGEYIRAVRYDRRYRAGLCLAGLLIKPQFLFIIGLALIIQRSTKILAGLATGSIAIIGTSFFMAGMDGFISLIKLWSGFTRGVPASVPEVMMNWRMIGLNLTAYLGPVIPWVFTGAGMAVTFALAIYIWIRPIDPSSHNYILALFGTFAATIAVSWHSHSSSATILIPPLIYLLYKLDNMPKNLITAWVFIPPMFRFLVFILSILIQEGILSNHLTGMVNILTAISLLVLSMYILVWTVVRIHQLDSPATIQA